MWCQESCPPSPRQPPAPDPPPSLFFIFFLHTYACRLFYSYDSKRMLMSFASKCQKDRSEMPRISDAEWPVMKVVWGHKTTTAKRVVEALANETAWKLQTVQTLMTRLVLKGVLAADKSSREHIFTPLVTEQECRQAVSRSFLARVFDGEIAPFLACFLEHKKLTRKEIEELKRILEEKG